MRATLAMMMFLAGSAQAATTTVDFSSDGYDDDFANGMGVTSLERQGYMFDINGAFLAPIFTSQAGIGMGIAGNSVEMTKAGGGVFSIYSLDIVEDALGDGLSITGYLQAGGEVSTTFILDNPSQIFALTTFSFGSEWQDLTSVTMSTISASGSAAVVDNIVVSAVPVPAALWLFGSALAGLGWIKRKPAI